MKLYYHKTSGGAEYLMDTYIVCPNGHREGHINDKTKYVVRIDGDITKDAEIMGRAVYPRGWSECNHYVKDKKGLCVRCGHNTLRLTNKKLKAIK